MDISEQMQREHELELFATSAAALGRAATLAAAQQIVLDAACQALNTDTAVIATVDRSADVLVVDRACGDWCPAGGVTMPLAASVLGQVVTTRQPFVSEGPDRTPLAVNPKLLGTRSVAACVPLAADGGARAK